MNQMESEEKYIDFWGHKFYLTQIIWAGIILFLVYVFFGRYIIGTEIPGSMFEKPAYDRKFYVNLFKDSDYSKNYRVVGDLHVFRECDGGGDEEECYSVGVVEKATFPNGGYITFDDCRVQLNKKIYCRDVDFNEWYVELTNVPVK